MITLGGVSMTVSSNHGGSNLSVDGSGDLSDHLSGVSGVSSTVDDSVETVVVISGVLNGAGGAIGLNKGVLSLHDISIAVLALGLVVSGVGIVHGVLELVLGMRLPQTRSSHLWSRSSPSKQMQHTSLWESSWEIGWLPSCSTSDLDSDTPKNSCSFSSNDSPLIGHCNLRKYRHRFHDEFADAYL
ncbi:hypothetical protein B566_EDAN009415 [Ephemera danica]|nr:hypothetical protein B566_EDAN009415 [Ephemera danica]